MWKGLNIWRLLLHIWITPKSTLSHCSLIACQSLLPDYWARKVLSREHPPVKMIEEAEEENQKPKTKSQKPKAKSQSWINCSHSFGDQANLVSALLSQVMEAKPSPYFPLFLQATHSFFSSCNSVQTPWRSPISSGKNKHSSYSSGSLISVH